MLAESLSTVPPFSECGGITGRGCKLKYTEISNRHREEVKNGEFISGVREGMDTSTHDAINTCILHEEEAMGEAARTKGEVAEYELKKKARAQKVSLLLLRQLYHYESL